MNNENEKNDARGGVSIYRLLFVVVLFTFILQAILLPFLINFIYDKPPVRKDRTVCYERGKLTFGAGCEFDENGSMKLDLFDATYRSANSADGANILVPGTDGRDVIQLKNKVSGTVKYTAIAYLIRASEDIPVKAELLGSDYDDMDTFALPDGVSSEQVIRAVSGELEKNEVVNFDILWKWDFLEDDDRDALDTELGNKDELDNVIIGVKLTVEDSNVYLTPLNPHLKLATYIGAMTLTLAFTILLLVFIYKDRDEDEEA